MPEPSTPEAPPIRPSDVPSALRGRTPPWGALCGLALLVEMALALALRGWRLSAEGFADDEVHKWFAAQRYLAGDYGGDDLEHPMLMKWLIVLVMKLFGTALPPETVTRLPNVVAGGLTVLAVAALGRRLFGRAAGLIAAGLMAVAPTVIGYTRLAKEDALCTLFLVLLLWCLAEAHAAAADGRERDRGHWEVAGAVCLGLMFASKYFLFFALIPLLAYVALRAGGTPWRIPVRRWALLLGVAVVAFIPLNFVVLRPSTWAYVAGYLRGDAVEDRMTSETVLFMGRLYANFAFQFRQGPPLSYWPLFAAVKLAPPTVVLAVVGLVLALGRRRPSDRILLVWIGMWFLSFTVASVKYARYFLSATPALLLLAADMALSMGRWVATRRSGDTVPVTHAYRDGARAWFVPALGVLLIGTELSAGVAVAPHFRLYVNALGGGEKNVAWFFPQCDYSDVGAREAILQVAAHAERGAEVTSEIAWPVRYYTEAAGRSDLLVTHMSNQRACRGGRVCYVIVQEGRRYWHNASALDRLAALPPWHVERIRGAEVVKVYRLDPAERLFP